VALSPFSAPDRFQIAAHLCETRYEHNDAVYRTLTAKHSIREALLNGYHLILTSKESKAIYEVMYGVSGGFKRLPKLLLFPHIFFASITSTYFLGII